MFKLCALSWIYNNIILCWLDHENKIYTPMRQARNYYIMFRSSTKLLFYTTIMLFACSPHNVKYNSHSIFFFCGYTYVCNKFNLINNLFVRLDHSRAIRAISFFYSINKFCWIFTSNKNCEDCWYIAASPASTEWFAWLELYEYPHGINCFSKWATPLAFILGYSIIIYSSSIIRW